MCQPCNAGVFNATSRYVRAHLLDGVRVPMEAESIAVVVVLGLNRGDCGSWCASVHVMELLSCPSVTTGKAVTAWMGTPVHYARHAQDLILINIACESLQNPAATIWLFVILWPMLPVVETIAEMGSFGEAH